MSWYQASFPPSPSFHSFRALPPEIRLRIWHFALQTPHMINLHVSWKYDAHVNGRIKYLYASREIRRPLLAVNCEARAAALAAYLPGFYDISGKTVVWVNPKIDTLFVDGWEVKLLTKYGIAKWIERVAFPIEDWLCLYGPAWSSLSIPGRIRSLCENMTALKEVQLVTWDELKWGKRVKSWEDFMVRSGFGSRLGTGPGSLDMFVSCFIKTCGSSVGNFRQNLAQVRECMGLLSSQTSVMVRAVALDKSGLDPRWDHELELL